MPHLSAEPCHYDGMEFDPVEDAELALQPVAYAEPWNGWAVPVVTATEYARFITAWARNDRNGTWGAVVEASADDGRRYLVHVPNDAEPFGLSLDGEPVKDNSTLRLGLPFELTLGELDYSVDHWPAGEGGVYALDGQTFVRTADVV